VAFFAGYAVFTTVAAFTGLAFHYYGLVHSFSSSNFYASAFSALWYDMLYLANVTSKAAAQAPIRIMLESSIMSFTSYMWLMYTISVLVTLFFSTDVVFIFSPHNYVTVGLNKSLIEICSYKFRKIKNI
jgi:hypothetical protein